MAGFVQMDFDVDVMDRRLRGNVGVRVANTRVDGTGSVGGAANGALGTIVTARNEYTDVLPAGNLTYEVSGNFQIRFAAAKTMSRPQLSALTPGTTSFPTGLNAGGAAPSITVGNPYLSPFRSTNLDLSFEYYWGTNGFVGLALFQKDINSFPQQVAGVNGGDAGLPDAIADETWRVNLKGLWNVLDCAQRSDTLRRVVHVGSCNTVWPGSTDSPRVGSVRFDGDVR